MINAETATLISDVISLIHNQDFSSSITTLSQVLNINRPYLRHLLRSICESSCLSAQCPLDWEPQGITRGDYDDEVIDSGFFYDMLGTKELLSLSFAEQEVLNQYFPGLLNRSHESVFEIKQTVLGLSPEVCQRMNELQDILAMGDQEIHFRYQNRHGKMEAVSCIPVHLSQNITENLVYLIDTRAYQFRLDRIHGSIRHTRRTETNPAPIDPMLRYVWCASYNEPEPVHVRLMIPPALRTQNLLAKIETDTSFRRETRLFYEMNGIYYYEDDVLGLQDFRRWVRSYGASLVILEPTEQHRLILENTFEKIRRYELLAANGL